MHGLLNSAFCVECGWQGPRHGRLEGNRECLACERDALRPDIVLFGEAPRYMRQIEAALEQCDLFIAIGTSATVYPAAGFIEIAKANGAQTHRFDIKATQNSEVFNRCHVGPASQTVSAWVNEFTII
jgi:NAD-dependent deacetylase